MIDSIGEIIPCTQEDQERSNRILRGVLMINIAVLFPLSIFLYNSILSNNRVESVFFLVSLPA